MFQTSRNHLLCLSALGVWGLWGHAYFNGMFNRLDTITRTLRFPDTRPLRSSYTGLALLDTQLTLLSAFYDVLTNSLSSGPRLLFFDINYAVACANLWTLVESRRRGVRSWFLKYPAWAMVLCNTNGAAIVLPLYLYLVCRSKARLRDPAVPMYEAAILPVTTLVMLLQPLLIFAPAWMGSSGSEAHHGYIALFQVAPIIILGLYLGLASILSRKAAATSSSKESKKLIVASLTLAGTVASAVHFYTVVGALRTRDSDASLTRLFVPAWGLTDPIKTLATTGRQSVEYAALLENFHLFSQWDWIVICLASIVFAHLLLSRRDGLKMDKSTSLHEVQELIYLAAATFILGPGGAGSFALAIHEERI
ncbi:Transcriptional regulatory protein [Conoideocrella luteorostrata]|uniref:Transcriptional regulatory protein n=1 Tax=Conoideocrella luteorostrata TaxID=1105319 RepID=A0AAJ0D0C6_9HYPO|nr:Transcriptional regulatory protein [Conoideocrella luteorostrata]